ncbi:haloacid dehalogenase type II [uncultured Meiothermus sp.]|jgi:2-haloacid dehalogenase|uniref:haloacid dehalogenase type II n=1 Tax=uncultured Meiothermus sp. TaxID=157471 RepID=UPI002614EDAE|nr:haloacid dehalogenase type II [uncultured Meiothermus sp.]
MPKAVVFDAYGTLFDVQGLSQVCEDLFPSRGATLSELWRRKQLEYTWLLALMGQYQDFWTITRLALHHASGTLKLPLDAGQQERLMQGFLTLPAYPEVPVVLPRLSSRYPLAILSNGSEEMLGKVVQHNRLQNYFTHLLSAESTRTYKPSPKVYDLAIRAFFAVPEKIVFVSSNGWDVAGARAFGFKVAWCNRWSLAPETHTSEPDWTLESLEELESLPL